MIVCPSCHREVPGISVFCDQCAQPLRGIYQYAPYVDPWAVATLMITAFGVIYPAVRDYRGRRRCGCCYKRIGFRHVRALGPDGYWYWYDACNNCGGLNPYIP
jgi:hypothetical protein